MVIDEFWIWFAVGIGLGLLYQLWKKKPRRRRKYAIGQTLEGIAEVVDGDTIKVDGVTVRLAGLDAPELGQIAQSVDKEWFDHGLTVKTALTRAIQGRKVSVTSIKRGKYGRVVGVVMCEGLDIGALLVGNGHAIAAYGNQYKALEEQARREGKGIWGHAVSYDPRSWRQRHRR